MLECDNGSAIRTLRLPGDVKSRGYIHVYWEDVKESRTNVKLHFGAANLSKKGLLGKCDSFFEINRLLSKPDHFHPIYRSEVVTRTACPKWVNYINPFKINLINLNSHLLPLFISHRSSREKIIKYQANSSCVIMSVILMTTLFYKALILQAEIWCWSILRLKGLIAHYWIAGISAKITLAGQISSIEIYTERIKLSLVVFELSPK